MRSVIYASLFDYPLTVHQLHKSLIGVRAGCNDIVSWWRTSELLQSTVEYRDGLFFPAGRADLVATRARRETLSRELLDRDRRILSLLSKMPFVRMVALSGSLAHLNAEGSADLDLFVITARRRVWLVTVTMLLLSKVMGIRRHICMNYAVSEAALQIEQQDLFSANQIIHLRPIFGSDVFARFVTANPFVRTFYPNFELPESQAPSPKSTIERIFSLGPAQLGERACRSLYRWHLRRKEATWTSRDDVRLEDECLKLHTSSHRASTMRRFDSAMTAAVSDALATAVGQ